MLALEGGFFGSFGPHFLLSYRGEPHPFEVVLVLVFGWLAQFEERFFVECCNTSWCFLKNRKFVAVHLLQGFVLWACCVMGCFMA